MIHDGASGQQQPDFGPAPRDAAVAQFRQADLTLPELWTYYYGIGGNADEVVLDAYLNDMLELPPPAGKAPPHRHPGDVGGRPMKGVLMSERIEAQDFHYGGGGEGLDEFVLQLQDLILQSSDVRDFLTDMATIIASRLSHNGNHISCGITVIRNKRPTTVASSDARARSLDELQNSFGDGPCLTALRTGTMLYVPDLDTEVRWPKYNGAARAADIRSILAIPMRLQASAQAVVNLYASYRDGFSHPGIEAAASLTGTAAKALDLALSMAQLRSARDDLSAALKSRTVIDTAVGVIIAQNRCSRDEAFDILVKTSSHRNVKLREVAASLVSSVSGDREFPTPYDD
jgi:hypothetical protein